MRKILPIILLAILVLTGCNMQMSADERVNMLYGTQETGTNENIAINAPKNDQISKLTVEYIPYTLEQLAEVFFEMPPEEVQARKKSDVSLYTNESDFLEKNCGVHIVFPGFTFNSIEDAEFFDLMVSFLPYMNENKTYNGETSEFVLKQYFPKKQLDNFSLEEAKKLCDTQLKKLGFSISYASSYALDSDSLNNAQKEIKEKLERELPAPGFEYDDSGNLVGELNSWTQNAYLFLYRQSYRGIPIEGNGIRIYCDKENGIFKARTENVVLSEHIVQEKNINLMDGEAVLTMAQPVLKKIGVTMDQVYELSVVYRIPSSEINSEVHTASLIPTWKVMYHQELNGEVVSDYILLDGETGERV